ncbi:MAG: OmpA family protein [Prevotella sp.]|nr:OmpA family protein [Prevotella sp.]
MRNLRYLSALLLTVLLFTSCGADKNLKRGEKYLALGEYFDAGNEYKTAYSKTPAKERPRRGQIAKKMAYCYEKINSTQKAIAAYRNVIRYNQDDGATHLSFAQQLMKNGNYKEAAEQYRIALDSMPDNQLARDGLSAALDAPRLKEAGSRYIVKKMDIFNSRRADYSPMLMGENHEYLYFTSTRNEAQGDELSGITGTKNGDIFFSQKDDKGKWSKPQRVESGLNTDYDEGASCVTPDEREMYLTQCSTDPSYPRYAKIVKSSRSDAAWGKSSDVELTRDTLSSYAHPAISPDGEWLYFSSDMPGGQGGIDIWRIRLTSNGVGGVENLGAPINTAGDEMFPTFRPNGDLYFSSTGHPGLGGLDIFIATVGSNGRYQLEHPGYPLNSQGDDFGMTFEGPHNRGFFCSNRGDGRGWDHIFSFENPEIIQTVKGWVYERDGYELPAAQVYMVGNDGTNEKLSVLSDGSFERVVKPGVDYVFLATCRGYLNHKEELSVKATDESEETVLQFALASISVPVMIDNIFYDYDKAILRPEAVKSLDELVMLLNENPNVTIELSAHCDYHGSQAYNIGLSQRRAESVVNYLIEHGIAADRLTPKGYGKEKPKVVRKKLAAQYPWMKEGDVLTQEYITALDQEKQAICDQLNRRTEFIVLRTTYGMFDSEGKPTNLPQPKSKPQSEDNADEGFEIEE